jgi:hypothetical protein
LAQALVPIDDRPAAQYVAARRHDDTFQNPVRFFYFERSYVAMASLTLSLSPF